MSCKNGSAIEFCHRIYALSPQSFGNTIISKLAANRSSILSIAYGNYSIKNIRKRDVFRRVFCDNLPCQSCFSDDVDVDICAYEFNGGSLDQLPGLSGTFEERKDDTNTNRDEVCLILSDNEEFRKEYYSIIENYNKQRGEDT
jgi:hypothetical protein